MKRLLAQRCIYPNIMESYFREGLISKKTFMNFISEIKNSFKVYLGKKYDIIYNTKLKQFPEKDKNKMGNPWTYCVTIVFWGLLACHTG